MTPEQLQDLINQYKALRDAGSISQEEHVSLLVGINIMEGIGEDVESLQLKETLNTILTAAVAVASMAY